VISRKHTALIIDDEQGSVEALKWVLKDDFNIYAFNNPGVAIRLVEKNYQHIDVIFLDLLMEGMSGIEFLQMVKSLTNNVEVVIVSACRNKDLILEAMREGAFDCVEKPFSVAQLEKVAERAVQKRIENICIQKIINIVERSVGRFDSGQADSVISQIYADDQSTFAHSRRVAQVFAQMITRYLGTVDQAELAKMKTVAFLHDIGKIGVNIDILTKQGTLNEWEYEEVKRHPRIGYNILKRIDSIKYDLDMVLHHQERFDGSGYPEKLRGEQISLYSRMLSIADAFDAMTDSRPYRQGMNTEKALHELKGNAGTQFDAKLVDFFVDNLYNLTS